MRTTLWLILGLIILGVAGWKFAEMGANREAEEKQQQLDEERRKEEAQQQELLRLRDAKRASYVDLISKAAFGSLVATQRPTIDLIDFDQQKQRLSELFRAKPSELNSSRLVSLWADVHRHAERGLLTLYRIDGLGQPTRPSGWDVLQSLQKDSATEAWWRRLNTETDKAKLQSEFREIEANLNRSIADLLRAIPDLALPDAGETIKVTYLPAWRGAFAGETLQVRNVSNVDLQHALVFVTATSKTGETLTHLHYTDSWAPASSLIAQYVYGATEYANSQALDQTETVDVLAVAPSGLNHGNYKLDQAEWDTRAKDYLGKVTWQGAYLPPTADLENGNHLGPGYQFSFSGLPKLPVRAARVRFFKGAQFEDTMWDLSTIEADKPYPVHSNSMSEPETAELTLWFQDTTVTVTLPNGGPARLGQEPIPFRP